MSSIMRRRNGLMASSVMGMLLFEVRLRTPSSSDRTLQPVIAPPTPLAAAPYRASGLVLWHLCDLTRCLILVRDLATNGHRALPTTCVLIIKGENTWFNSSTA